MLANTTRAEPGDSHKRRVVSRPRARRQPHGRQVGVEQEQEQDDGVCWRVTCETVVTGCDISHIIMLVNSLIEGI